jgi:serine/threonine protein kinase
MGLVWLAEDEVLCRPVALKQLVPRSPVSEELRMAARARALSEARAAARVDHIGAVRVYDLVEEDGRPWIVMELLSGRTLKDALAAEGLPVRHACRRSRPPAGTIPAGGSAAPGHRRSARQGARAAAQR